MVLLISSDTVSRYSRMISAVITSIIVVFLRVIAIHIQLFS